MLCLNVVARIAALALTVSATGCSALSLGSPKTMDTAEAAAPAAGMAIVEIRPHEQKPRVLQLPLDKPMHVQDAVEQSRKVKKLRRVLVDLYRANEHGQRHKMNCDWDLKTKRIKPEYDYALRPGDYIVISEDTNTMVDDMFNQIAGPLRRMVR